MRILFPQYFRGEFSMNARYLERMSKALHSVRVNLSIFRLIRNSFIPMFYFRIKARCPIRGCRYRGIGHLAGHRYVTFADSIFTVPLAYLRLDLSGGLYGKALLCHLKQDLLPHKDSNLGLFFVYFYVVSNALFSDCIV